MSISDGQHRDRTSFIECLLAGITGGLSMLIGGRRSRSPMDRERVPR